MQGRLTSPPGSRPPTASCGGRGGARAPPPPAGWGWGPPPRWPGPGGRAGGGCRLALRGWGVLRGVLILGGRADGLGGRAGGLLPQPRVPAAARPRRPPGRVVVKPKERQVKNLVA